MPLTKQYWKSVNKSRPNRDRVHIVIPEESTEQTLCGYALANMSYEQVPPNKKEWGDAPICSRCQKSLSAYRGHGLKDFNIDTQQQVEKNKNIPEKHKQKIQSVLKKAKDKKVKIDTFMKELDKQEPTPPPELTTKKEENSALAGLRTILPGFKETVNTTINILCEELKYNQANSLDVQCFTQITTLKELIKALNNVENM